ncbi:zinc carboxypeptidase [Terracoccus luteus]|uniref:Zinc carboxypeptidase n=1 Tax=Terracoccus luteus TaxID=53356 RepID=A0A495Y0D6_9MICO|nr:M14 family zinc carboxypeptidase [Terracoccus luteus]RKT78223.1 zinc carboxypeptidase [Terracoccus luteus]
MRLKLPDRAAFERLVASGADIAATPAASPRSSGDASPLVDVVVTGTALKTLQSQGARVVQVIARAGDGTANFRASKAAAAARTAAGLAAQKGGSRTTAAADATGADTLHFLQSYWWTSKGQTFVQVEVATTAVQDPDVEIQVQWETADGQTGTFPLQRFVDADEYQYHVALPQAVPSKPVKLVATSSLGGTATQAPKAWPGTTAPPAPSGYQQDFISAYMTPTDIQQRLRRLARQYPELVELVDLPNKTNGYRRTAVGYVGDPAAAAIVVETKAFGSAGGNGIQVKTVAGTGANRPLAATFRDRVLTITLATGADGTVVSTTDEVAAFVAEKFPTRFTAFVEDGSAGKVMPVVSPVRLDDGLTASGLSRPWQVQALRIGTHRDGSKPGVLIYSQEHAREWATPLVTLEFAERMLANAKTDAETKALLDSVDVFVLPVTNPDGANYSFNDYNFQRKNLDNFCTGAARDPKNRNRWGVDVNRNYTVGSVFDGYVGASTDCLSTVAAGTGELSEAESSNVISLAKNHSNIRYAMNVHSYGGYFMWPPGAYSLPGRITLPRPDAEQSAAFLASAKRIVGAISTTRGTVTWPSNTGPVADVLYSAAGNSADQLYYEFGIYAWDFEVGNDLWNATTQQWEGVGFQPPYDEAHAESQEYAAGLVELVRVARDDAADEPTTTRREAK